MNEDFYEEQKAHFDRIAEQERKIAEKRFYEAKKFGDSHDKILSSITDDIPLHERQKRVETAGKLRKKFEELDEDYKSHKLRAAQAEAEGRDIDWFKSQDNLVRQSESMHGSEKFWFWFNSIGGISCVIMAIIKIVLTIK